MSKRVKYFVSKTDEGWNVKKAGANRASGNFDTKAEAIERGRSLAKAQELGQLVIKKGDGKIQTEYTYGQDPHPPAG